MQQLLSVTHVLFLLILSFLNFLDQKKIHELSIILTFLSLPLIPDIRWKGAVVLMQAHQHIYKILSIIRLIRERESKGETNSKRYLLEQTCRRIGCFHPNLKKFGSSIGIARTARLHILKYVFMLDVSTFLQSTFS